jgi:hypothetical protein
MRFHDVLKACKGQLVVINNNEERTVMDVDEDFVVLRGGNPQMQITEFLPLSHIIKVIRADYATGDSSTSLEVTLSGGDIRKGGGGGHF